jgi:hypothetical protein
MGKNSQNESWNLKRKASFPNFPLFLLNLQVWSVFRLLFSSIFNNEKTQNTVSQQHHESGDFWKAEKYKKLDTQQ